MASEEPEPVAPAACSPRQYHGRPLEHPERREGEAGRSGRGGCPWAADCLSRRALCDESAAGGGFASAGGKPMAADRPRAWP
eukprot:9809463-Alexandrium_andersonii.AAC.1